VTAAPPSGVARALLVVPSDSQSIDSRLLSLQRYLWLATIADGS